MIALVIYFSGKYLTDPSFILILNLIQNLNSHNITPKVTNFHSLVCILSCKIFV